MHVALSDRCTAVVSKVSLLWVNKDSFCLPVARSFHKKVTVCLILKLYNSETPNLSKQKSDLALTSHWEPELWAVSVPALRIWDGTWADRNLQIKSCFLPLHWICISRVFGSAYPTVWQISCSSMSLKHKVSTARGKIVMKTAVCL